MRIGLIGGGKVGITLCYLLKKEHQIIGVYDINSKNQSRAQKILGISKNPPYPELVAKSEVLFFATPDDEIKNAFNQASKYIKNEKYVFHFSGLLPAEVFPEIKNVYRASVHPFTTLPKLALPPAKKSYLLFAEGDSRALKIIQKIFTKSHFFIKKIKKEAKGFHHLLGVFASNLLIGLLEAILELLRQGQWRKKNFYDLVLPIMEETITNVKKYSIQQALSGPLKRGDLRTIKRHLRVLRKDRKLLNTYKVLSLNILKYAPVNKKAQIAKDLIPDY